MTKETDYLRERWEEADNRASDLDQKYNNLISALAAYVRTNTDYNLGAFLEGYLGIDENTAYTEGLKPLPDCPKCSGKTVFHADASDDKLIVQCTSCGRIGEL